MVNEKLLSLSVEIIILKHKNLTVKSQEKICQTKFLKKRQNPLSVHFSIRLNICLLEAKSLPQLWLFSLQRKYVFALLNVHFYVQRPPHSLRKPAKRQHQQTKRNLITFSIKSRRLNYTVISSLGRNWKA